MRLVILTVTVILTLFLEGSGRVDAHSPPPPGAMRQGMLDRLTGRDLEIAFVTSMIRHHTAATDMARLATSRAARADVRGAAAKIISAQRQEIEDMTAWLRSWYRLSPDEGERRMSRMAGMDQMMDQMEGRNKKMMAFLESVRGEAFDRAFLEMDACRPRRGGAMRTLMRWAKKDARMKQDAFLGNVAGYGI